ncbi:MAG: hypothetical protein ACJAUG_001367 [Halioglobus sp.]|jgi:hypothetical protein
MFEQVFIAQQVFKFIEVLGQRHFVEECMNAVVTLPANIDTCGQLLTVVVFLKESASVHFFGDQVMKGEGGGAPTQGTITSVGSAAAQAWRR